MKSVSWRSGDSYGIWKTCLPTYGSILILSRAWFRCGQTDRIGFEVLVDS